MKANLNAALNHEFNELLDREAWGQTMTGRTEDHREAVKAFLEKRPRRSRVDRRADPQLRNPSS